MKELRFLIPTLLILFTISHHNSACAEELNYSEILENIGKEIAALREEYPQLIEFLPDQHVHIKSLKISYGYKTHKATHRGGWTSGVPNPDPGGIWFYIDFHDPKSSAQIHTQPMVRKGVIGNKEVIFLILEGEKTRSVNKKIWEILKRNSISIKTRSPNG
ncbi:hypothetical protein ACFL6N_00735 [Thermodesulfobacteriota bacterium]